MIAYFNRNVFHHVRYETRGAVKGDRRLLHQAIWSGKLSLLLSIVTLSETLLRADEKEALNEIRWILDLTRQKKVVKDTVMLIDESLKAYAAGLPSPNPYTTTLDLSILRHPTPQHLQGLRRVAQHNMQDRMEFVDQCTRRLELLNDEFRNAIKPPPFDEFLSGYGSAWAELS